MESLIDVLTAFVAILLSAKLFEMLLHSALPGSRAKNARRWPITNLISLLPAPSRGAAIFVFNHKLLMLALATLSIFARNAWNRWMCAVVLFAGSWVAIYRLLTDKFAFGDYDAKYRRELAAAARIDLPREKIGASRRTFYFDAYLLAMVVVIAYAAMFSAITGHDDASNIFEHVSNGCIRAIDFFYFSLVTIGTVGYGDVVPKFDTAHVHLLRLLVSSEIVAGFLILTVFFVRITVDDRDKS